ncbi:MAG: hypothetical protein M3276_08235 [Actinomycetota bacterium]|nr:hypothetical protein [Actinomycetota bacterium]
MLVIENPFAALPAERAADLVNAAPALEPASGLSLHDLLAALLTRPLNAWRARGVVCASAGRACGYPSRVVVFVA